jgi:hypothetical protein
MIALNKNNGVITFFGNSITLQTSIQDLYSIGFSVQPRVKNQGWETFIVRKPGEEKASLFIFFFNGKLSRIDIYYSTDGYTTSSEDLLTIKNILHTIGGEEKYTWGKVSLSKEDKFGSICTIVISYND